MRTIDISKGGTRFCNTSRIEPEADKIFAALARANWFKELPRSALIAEAAVAYGDLNMIHPSVKATGALNVSCSNTSSSMPATRSVGGQWSNGNGSTPTSPP